MVDTPSNQYQLQVLADWVKKVCNFKLTIEEQTEENIDNIATICLREQNNKSDTFLFYVGNGSKAIHFQTNLKKYNQKKLNYINMGDVLRKMAKRYQKI